MCLRQSYERREIAEVRWIDSNNNLADTMTKSKPCTALKDLIDSNTINIRATEWVERAEKNKAIHKELLVYKYLTDQLVRNGGRDRCKGPILQ